MSSPPGSPTEAGFESHDTNLPTATSFLVDGTTQDTLQNDRDETSSTIDDDSSNLPTTTSPVLNGTTPDTLQNDRSDTSSILDDDSSNLPTTTNPLLDDATSDTTLTDPEQISPILSEVHDDTVIVSSVKATGVQGVDLQDLAAAANLLRQLDFPTTTSTRRVQPCNTPETAAALPDTTSAWTEQTWSFSNLQPLHPSRAPYTQFPRQPRHLTNGFHDEDHSAIPTTPTPRQGSLARIRVPQPTTNGDIDGYAPRNNVQALRDLENAARLRRAATTTNNNLRDLDVAFPQVNGILPETAAPAEADIATPHVSRRHAINGLPHTPARPGSPEATASPQPHSTHRLRRVGRSSSLRSLSLSPEPILPSPDRQRTGTPSPPASDAGMDQDAAAEAATDAALEAFVERLAAVAAGFAAAPEPEPQQVDEVIDDWRAPDDYMSDDEDEEDDREGGAPLNLDEFPVGDVVGARLRAGFQALAAARHQVDLLDGDDGDLPAQGNRGAPAAVRARMELLLVEENFTGAIRGLMEDLAFEREVAGVARRGFEHFQEEARRLTGLLGRVRVEAGAASDEAFAYASHIFVMRMELAVARRRLRDAGL
ncbi:hypothetical protein PV05_02792 [Exophiala xenobiotica]|uniref:Uncharacterized protein n=1 Tax=Exophiala xenobiotica TaxID=348802 RepID=A0A0D2ERB0_9EURO|nr:uncharacterized protein PV05_02792 [Exophiala xenobiotica]KIW58253.1 hypothetical protein PV05_02792 [Exophiala xenobiotica]